MDFYLKNDLCGNSYKMGSIIEEKYAKSVADCDFIGDVRGKD
jgi:4-aminobutyrate aminotransferase-like enzyme